MQTRLVRCDVNSFVSWVWQSFDPLRRIWWWWWASHQGPAWAGGMAARPAGSSGAHSSSGPASLRSRPPAAPWRTGTGRSWRLRPAETQTGGWRRRRRRRRRPMWRRRRKEGSSCGPSEPSAPAGEEEEEGEAEEEKGKRRSSSVW